MKKVLVLLCWCVSLSVWAADWNKPSITDTYSNYTSFMTARDVDIVKGLDPATTAPTNVPVNAIRWSSASAKWQKYNGTAWVDLAATYSINAATVGGYAAGNGASQLLLLDGSGLVPLADIPSTLTGKSADTVDNIDSTALVQTSGAQTVAGVKTLTSVPVVSTAAPAVKLDDTTAGAADFWVYADGNVFSLLTDRDANGAWDTPHPLQLVNATSAGTLYGSTIWTTSNDGAGSGLDADTVDGYHAGNAANQVLLLDASGLVPLADIPATLTGKAADTVDGIDSTSFARVDATSSFVQAVSFAATVSSTAACALGYTRIGTNYCAKTGVIGNNGATNNTCISLSAPSASAKAVVLKTTANARTINSIGGKYAFIGRYLSGDLGCSTLVEQLSSAVGYEYVAKTNEDIGADISTSIFPLETTGGSYRLLCSASTSTSSCTYTLLGYFD